MTSSPGVDRVFHRCGAGFVRFAMNVALLDACSGDHASVAIGPVVTAVGAVAITGRADAFLWAAPEFPDGHDELIPPFLPHSLRSKGGFKDLPLKANS